MSRAYVVAVAVSLAGGAVLPVQAMLNAKLGRVLGAPSWAGVVSAGLSAFVLLAVSLAYSGAPAISQSVKQLPTGAWLGGLLGAVYMFAAIFGVKHLGAAGMIACTLLGQLVGGLALDTSGVLSDPVPLNWHRVIGCSLAAAGVVVSTMRS